MLSFFKPIIIRRTTTGIVTRGTLSLERYDDFYIDISQKTIALHDILS